uniref:tRNA 2'-phosphotransferase 1-like n=1 Tax=Styela clava TaxID=7725 RepID=UPI0019399921|nr:tRNA 2'-phosphotransferase 1-like [Styela clava]
MEENDATIGDASQDAAKVEVTEENDATIVDASQDAAKVEVTTQQQPGAGRRGKKGKKTKYKPLDLNSLPDPPASSTSRNNGQSQYQQKSSWTQPPRQQPQSVQGGGYSEPKREQNSFGQQRQPYQSHRGPQQHYGGKTDSVALSRALATLLRHGKPSNIPIDSHGFADIDRIVSHPSFSKFNASVKEIQNIVTSNDKKRFEIEQDSGGRYQIRAVQGHSIRLEAEKSGLSPLTDPNKFKTILHGTYEQNWRKIKKQGLNRMSRSHIHFTIGHIGESHVTSGMRSNCEIIIELDLEKALEAGLKFYVSTNNVVLTEGDESGTVSAKYFKSTIKKWNHKMGKFEMKEFTYSES